MLRSTMRCTKYSLAVRLWTYAKHSRTRAVAKSARIIAHMRQQHTIDAPKMAQRLKVTTCSGLAYVVGMGKKAKLAYCAHRANDSKRWSASPKRLVEAASPPTKSVTADEAADESGHTVM